MQQINPGLPGQKSMVGANPKGVKTLKILQLAPCDEWSMPNSSTAVE
jgi:hypothetical protein